MVKTVVKVSKPTNHIIYYSATQLAKKIISEEIKCSTVIKDYIERIKEVQPVINAIAEENFDLAYKEAQKIDDFIKNHAPLKSTLINDKPLLGVPITIKECFAIKGLSHACGVYSRRTCLSENTAPSVQALIDAGAIVIATSSMPELGLWWETYNTIRGRTKNPYDTRMITGGSSGGEGALIGSGASPLGLGSDVGGSIRMPAFFNGVFGHKPTAGIISNEGHYPPATGNLNDYLVNGPLAKRSEDLLTAMKVLTKKTDSSQNILKLDQTVDPRRIKYYSFCEDIMRPWVSKISPDLKLAQTQIIRHLECRLGIQVVKLTLQDLPEFDEAFTLWITALERSNGPWFSEIITGYQGKASAVTELSKWLFRTKNCHTLPCVTFLVQEALIKRFVVFRNTEKHTRQLSELKSKLSSILGSDGVLFFPSNPRFYYRHHHPFLTPLNFVYTAIFNVLGFPVTQCPLGTLSKFLQTTTMLPPSPPPKGHESLIQGLANQAPPDKPNNKWFSSFKSNGHTPLIENEKSFASFNEQLHVNDKTTQSDYSIESIGINSSSATTATAPVNRKTNGLYSEPRSTVHGKSKSFDCCSSSPSSYSSPTGAAFDKTGLHMPLGIQVVGNMNMDRLTLAVAQVLEQEFGGWDPSPFLEKPNDIKPKMDP